MIVNTYTRVVNGSTEKVIMILKIGRYFFYYIPTFPCFSKFDFMHIKIYIESYGIFENTNYVATHWVDFV